MAKSNRPWLQFSLRTGLLLVTAMCVALSLWVVPAERQRRVVTAIEAFHEGLVLYETDQGRKESFPIAFLRRWLPQDYFDEVEIVCLDGTPITDAGLADIQGLTSLQGLSLDNTAVSDAGLAHFPSLTKLQLLYLDNTRVTDAGLVYLNGLTGLRWLKLTNTHVTDTAVAKLRQELPMCQIARTQAEWGQASRDERRQAPEPQHGAAGYAAQK